MADLPYLQAGTGAYQPRLRLVLGGSQSTPILKSPQHQKHPNDGRGLGSVAGWRMLVPLLSTQL